MHSVELLHPDLPELIDALLRRKRWSWQALERGDLRIGDEVLDVDRLQWWLVNADPVLWVETNLVNKPEDGGGLWQLFPYQRPSLRFRGHVVHQDGAEVGKSREIVGLLLWGCLAAERGSVLVGSALDGDLDEIWEEVEWQLSANPFLAGSLRASTTKPYRRLTWRNGLRVLFRPAGHDGRAYRGIHVRGWLLHDEAAKVVNPRSWAEFWRAAKPGCEIRIYSVPTGDRQCTFQRIADNAVPAESIVPADTPKHIVEHLLRPPGFGQGDRGPARGRREEGWGGANGINSVKAMARDLGGRVWVKFHWPKTIMPHPFWSEERRQEFVGFYGGPDEPGYVHNVLGLPGDPEYSLFPERLLKPALTWIPDYLSISFRWDSRAGHLDALSRRLNPAYPWGDDGETPLSRRGNGREMGEGLGVRSSSPSPGEGGRGGGRGGQGVRASFDDDPDEAEGPVDALQPYLTVLQDTLDVSGWDRWDADHRRQSITDLAAFFIRPIPGDLTAGVDVGSATVTEILFERHHSSSGTSADTLVLRLHLTGWNWYAQRDFILALDAILHPAGGWGFDATGVGRVLVDLLAPDLGDRLSGYVFNRSTPAIDPTTGEAQLDPTSGREVLLSYKELATQLLERRLHGRGLDLPFDPEVRHLLANHTYSQSSDTRRFSKLNDHLVDGLRVAELRKLTADWAAFTPPLLHATPAGSSIATLEILRNL
ncbi:MAG TPA: hypothetical protein VN493_31075 [Thermoanaerobaculia bacterium]|nr:hypothetical protein [Thermoanaerobaculia bacterium]